MSATIKTEVSVGVSDEIRDALETATRFSGIKASTYGRISLVEKLVREGFLRHPGIPQNSDDRAA